MRQAPPFVPKLRYKHLYTNYKTYVFHLFAILYPQKKGLPLQFFQCSFQAMPTPQHQATRGSPLQRCVAVSLLGVGPQGTAQHGQGKTQMKRSLEWREELIVLVMVFSWIFRGIVNLFMFSYLTEITRVPLDEESVFRVINHKCYCKPVLKVAVLR